MVVRAERLLKLNVSWSKVVVGPKWSLEHSDSGCSGCWSQGIAEAKWSLQLMVVGAQRLVEEVVGASDSWS